MVKASLPTANITTAFAATTRAANASASSAALGFGIGDYRNRHGGEKSAEKSPTFLGCVHLRTSFTFEMSKGDRPAPDLKAPGKFVVLCAPGRVTLSSAAKAFPFMA